MSVLPEEDDESALTTISGAIVVSSVDEIAVVSTGTVVAITVESCEMVEFKSSSEVISLSLLAAC